jgi:hypothetical protein
MSITHIIITIIAIVLIQFLIGLLWYSKFLFGKLFVSFSNIDFENVDPKSVKNSFILNGISSLIKAIIIYYISYDLFILQSFYLFKFIVLIPVLLIMEMLNDVIWGEKSFKLYLLNATQSFIAIISSFIVAFVSYSLFF